MDSIVTPAPLGKFITINDLTIDVNQGEPRIRDIDVGKMLGYVEPRMVRKLIKRHWARLEKFAEISQRSTVERYESKPGVWQTREVIEYWLTQSQALVVVTKSETEHADNCIEMLIRVCEQVRKQMEHPANRQHVVTAANFEAIQLRMVQLASELLTQASELGAMAQSLRCTNQPPALPAPSKPRPPAQNRARIPPSCSQLPSNEALHKAVVDWLKGDTARTMVREQGGVIVSEVLTTCFGIPKDRQDRGMQVRVGTVLAGLGWKKRTVRVGYGKVNICEPPRVARG